MLRLGWLDAGALGYRDWDGEAWSDATLAQVVNEDGARIRPADTVMTPEGPVSIGGGGEGWHAIPRPEILVERDGEEVAYRKPIPWTSAVDPDGNVVLAYFAGGTVAVQRWDGDSWQWLGEPIVPRSYKVQARIGPTVAFDVDGNPIVAWRQAYTRMPDGADEDRYKTRRWRTKVRKWDGDDWTILAGEKSLLDENPGRQWPQQRPGDERNLRAEWEAGQEHPAVVAVSPEGRVVVGWHSMGRFLLWERREKGWRPLPEPAGGAADDQGVSLAWSELGLVASFAQVTEADGKRRPKEIVVRALGDDGWSTVGSDFLGASATLGPSHTPKLFSHNGSVSVAWIDMTSGAPELMASQFDGTQWQPFGEAHSEGGLGEATLRSSDPRLVVQESAVRVSWVEELEPGLPSGATRIQFASHEGQEWQPGLPFNLPHKPARYDVEWSANGAPVVLWEVRTGLSPNGLFVSALGANGWRRLKGRGDEGELVLNGKGAYDASMTLDAVGRPWVVWSHDGRVPQVRQWTGTQWIMVGKLSGPSRAGGRPDLAFDTVNGRAWVLWQGKSSNRANDMRIAWFDGDKWRNVGSAPWVNCDANINSGDPRGAVFDLDEAGRPVVAWATIRPATKKRPAKQSVHVCAWDGEAWNSLPELRGSTDLIGPGRDPNRRILSIDAKNGITLAWTHLDEHGRQVRAERWNGVEWNALGQREGEVSSCEGACLSPVVARGQTTCLAWEEQAEGSSNISVDCQQ